MVRQAKVLLEEERMGPDGAPRSKGIGFIEFAEHEHALCALRQLNNNPTTFTKARGSAGAGGGARLRARRSAAAARSGWGVSQRANASPALLSLYPLPCRTSAPLLSLLWTM